MTNPMAHGSAGSLAKTHERSNPTVAPNAPTQPVTSTTANDDPPIPGVVNPNGSSTTGGDGASNVKATTESASAEEVQWSTNTSLHADIPKMMRNSQHRGAVSIPTSPGSAATTLASATSDVTSTASNTADHDCIRHPSTEIGERCQNVGWELPRSFPIRDNNLALTGLQAPHEPIVGRITT